MCSFKVQWTGIELQPSWMRLVSLIEESRVCVCDVDVLWRAFAGCV
eukprot:COSAG06_NODE_2853_length_6171_cov_59.287055_5_plen_46_part_00